MRSLSNGGGIVKFKRQSDGSYKSVEYMTRPNSYPTDTPCLKWYEIRRIGRTWTVFYCEPNLSVSQDDYPTLKASKSSLDGTK